VIAHPGAVVMTRNGHSASSAVVQDDLGLGMTDL
jgi:hypothetical protein